MNYRRLGKQGVKISEVGLGSWITYGGTTEDKAALDCIHRAFDLGVNFFDTADVYERGEAEKVVGQAIRDFKRHEIVLATKCYFPMSDEVNDRGLSRKHIFESIAKSLKRLGTDYVDLYQCHRYDDATPLEETVRAMDDLVRQGKVLYWGVSQWTAVQIADACHLAARLGAHAPASNQPLYNMIRREIETNGVADVCAREGLGLVVYSPLAQGVLTGKYKPGAKPPAGSRATTEEGHEFIGTMVEDADLLARVERLAPVAADAGCTMAQLALAWCLRRKELSSVITGASRASQVEDNVKAAEVRLSDDLLARIDDALTTPAS
jgi:voltage-dependent potassium channel beta subunit